MGKMKFRTSTDENGRIATINIGGLLVLETALLFKNELVAVGNRIAKNVTINISELEEMDLSAVQLLVAFCRHLNQMKITYQLDWNITDEQKSLFINVGIGTELNMQN